MLPEFWIPQDLKAVLLKDGEAFAEMTEKSEEYRNVLKKLRNIDRLELSQSHYLQLLKLGLYLEEYQHRIDLRKFNIYGKKIARLAESSNKFRIYIKDLDKNHPVHKSCNLIEIFNCKNVTKKKFVLRVKKVENDGVIAVAYPEFCDGYNSEYSYNIRFRTNNYSFRCSHYALSLINSHKMTSHLFPVKRDNLIIVTPDAENQWINKATSENPEQRQAIRNIIRKTAFPAPYILYGPPGTGKTATLVEAVCQIWHNTMDAVLICAPSNAAADVITKRLLNYIPAVSLDRIYSRSRDSTLIDADIQSCSNYSNGRILKVNEIVVSSKRIVVSTLCTCTKLLFLDLSHSYSYVFIDEAGQATEPESLIAFNVISRHGDNQCQIVISGDPKQLGPSIRSKLAAPILGQSLLERLMKLEPYVKHNNNDYDSRYITKLLRNYRSHPAIIRVSNELYYENELLAYCSDQTCLVNKDFPPKFPVIFHGVNGREQKEENSTSSYNVAEAQQVLAYVNQLIGEKIGEKTICSEDIGIVTPFALQSKHLQKSLKDENLEDVSVGTVEIFQGQEKEVIIVSAVRTKTFKHENREHIGFLSNSRRFNVALTRAKAALVVVGNPTALQTDENWRYFLKFCQDNGACRGEKFMLNEKVEEKRFFESSCDEAGSARSEQSSELFDETFSILKIDDGIIRRKKNKFLLNGMYYTERECTIL